MGSYSAPAYSPQYLKAIIDNTNLVNEIILQADRKAAFQFFFNSSALYDGVFELEFQKNDNTWYDMATYNFTAGNVGDGSQAFGLGQFQGFDFKYPYSIRVRVSTQASVGVCTVYMVTQPGPANPLF